jgi:hypothetical protein
MGRDKAGKNHIAAEIKDQTPALAPVSIGREADLAAR